MDLNSMSISDLRRLQTRVANELQRRSETTKRALVKKMKKMVEDEGLSLEEVIGEMAQTDARTENTPRKRGPKPTLKKGNKLPPKYFHPENPEMGWSGHGRKPQWIIDWLAQDKPLQALENPPQT